MILEGVASGFSRKGVAAAELQNSSAARILPAEAGSHNDEFIYDSCLILRASSGSFDTPSRALAACAW